MYRITIPDKLRVPMAHTYMYIKKLFIPGLTHEISERYKAPLDTFLAKEQQGKILRN